jgi:hypothetical protein
MDKAHQKLESRAVTFCYPVPRTLQTMNPHRLTQKSEHSRSEAEPNTYREFWAARSQPTLVDEKRSRS